MSKKECKRLGDYIREVNVRNREHRRSKLIPSEISLRWFGDERRMQEVNKNIKNEI